MGSARSTRACVALAAGLMFVFAAAQAADSGGRRFRFDQDNVPGWALMTSAERAQHHQKLMSLRTLDECRAYMQEQREKMEARAQQRGRILHAPRFDVCDQLKAKGQLE